METSLPEVRVEEFAQLVERDVKDLSPAEVATLLNFLTPKNRRYWNCVMGTLGCVVNVVGGDACPDTSYTFRLVDAREKPVLAIHQYNGLHAESQCGRSHQVLAPGEQSAEAFAAFGRLLVLAETPISPG